MIEIVRVVDSKIVFLMHFFGDDDSTEEEDRMSLAGLMKNSPDNVCVIVGYDSNEVVCHVCGKRDEEWVWVYNAWSKVEAKYSAECFEMVKNWAKKLGINQLRCETYHRPEVMKRAFGWEKYSTIMKLDLGIAQ